MFRRVRSRSETEMSRNNDTNVKMDDLILYRPLVAGCTITTAQTLTPNDDIATRWQRSYVRYLSFFAGGSETRIQSVVWIMIEETIKYILFYNIHNMSVLTIPSS